MSTKRNRRFRVNEVRRGTQSGHGKKKKTKKKPTRKQNALEETGPRPRGRADRWRVTGENVAVVAIPNRVQWADACVRYHRDRASDSGGRAVEPQRARRSPDDALPSVGTGAPTGGAGPRRWRRRAQTVRPSVRQSSVVPRAGRAHAHAHAPVGRGAAAEATVGRRRRDGAYGRGREEPVAIV